MPEGWLFGAPRPWLTFRPRPSYLVTDAQKSALGARIRLSRYLRLLLAIPLVAATPLWMELVRGLSLLGNTLLVLSFYLILVHLLEYLMIRPILADLQRASQCITVAEMLRQQSAAMSFRSQAILSGFFGFATILSVMCLALGVSIDQDMLRYMARFSGAFCILWLVMLIAKHWTSRRQPDRSA